MDVTVRSATVDDAERLGQIKVQGWRAAYAGLLPAATLDALEATDWAQRFAARIVELAGRTDQSLLVADTGDTVAGYVSLGPDRGNGIASAGEVYALYVDPLTWRDGVGHQLMRSAEAELRRQGYQQAVLWVLEKNSAGRRFYERVGWSFDGERGERCEVENAPEVRYGKRLVNVSEAHAQA